jgi:hypothetical protein
MLAKFPPGDITYNNRTKSAWREFAFALHQIQQAVDPVISLRKVLNEWGEIGSALGERSRKRIPQIKNLRFS